MAGLLDYQPDPIGQGLLGLGTALMTPRAMGGGMAAGLNAFNTNALQAKQLQRQAQQDALREQLLQAQMQNFQSAAEERKAQAEAQRAALAQRQAQAEAQRGVLSSFMAPPMGFRDASVAITGNAPAGYMPPQAASTQITPEIAAKWVAAGGDLDVLRKLAESKDFGRAKVARTESIAGPDGMPRTQQLDDFGRPVGDALPQAVKLERLNTGNAFTAVNPYTPGGPIPINMSASERDSSARGWAGVANQRERLAFDKAQAGGGGGFEYRQTPEGLVVVPKVPSADGPVQARPVLNAAGVPVGGSGTGGTSPQQKVADAREAVDIIAEAEKYIKGATGSYAGAGLDAAARVFGASTPGAQNAARLKALEGMLVSKMPKMSGPQSDKDVLLYRQMAGQIGDDTLPEGTKMAALDTIKRLQRQYGGLPPEQPAAPKSEGSAPQAPPGQSFASMPSASQYRGKSMTDTVTGKTYKSNGFSWVEQ
jgi:hypothetical protein